MCSMKGSIALMTLACVTLVYAEPPASNYLPPQSSPSAQYGAPSFGSSGPGYQRPSQQYNAPSNSYAAPQQNNYSPSASYNAPSYSPQPSSSYGAPSGNGGNGGYGGYGNSEPARYNFEYNVQDYQSGNDFGHMESRDGDRTTGRYYVLLPDGRKQIVNYEADQNGYRPTITYEETNSAYNGNGNGNGNNNNNFNGYKK